MLSVNGNLIVAKPLCKRLTDSQISMYEDIIPTLLLLFRCFRSYKYVHHPSLPLIRFANNACWIMGSFITRSASMAAVRQRRRKLNNRQNIVEDNPRNRDTILRLVSAFPSRLSPIRSHTHIYNHSAKIIST